MADAAEMSGIGARATILLMAEVETELRASAESRAESEAGTKVLKLLM